MRTGASASVAARASRHCSSGQRPAAVNSADELRASRGGRSVVRHMRISIPAELVAVHRAAQCAEGSRSAARRASLIWSRRAASASRSSSSPTMRAGAPPSSTMRSASSSASSMSWVISSARCASRRRSSSSSCCISARVTSSSAPNGSSSSKDLRLARQTARQRRALRHAAGQLRRIAMPRMAEPDLGDRPRHAGLRAPRAQDAAGA